MAQVDIRSFGARCDGSDDSGAVQAALNSVPSTGGTVVISCSAGIGSNGIVLSGKSNVTVTGSGSGAGFRALSSTGRNIGGFGRVMFLIQNCTNCMIKDLTIDGRNVGVNPVGVEYSNGTTVQNVSVSNVGYHSCAGIAAIGNRGNSYIGNTVRVAAKSGDDGVRGLWIGNGNHETEYNATIANNTVSDVGATGIVAHVINSTIRDNYVSNAAGAGIKLVPTLGLGGQTTIEGNTLRNNLFHGIQLENADSAVIVQRNTIDANAMAGVYVSGGHYNNGKISGNTITNHKEAAIYLYNGIGISIDNNQIAGNGHGLLLESIGSNTMSNLTIASNNFTGQKQNGITMWGRGGTIQSVTIGSNAFSNQSQYGIFIEQASGNLSGVSASNNCFSNNSSGTIFDNRFALPPVASSGNCPSPAAPGSPTSPAPTADKTAPAVSITSPGNGATVKGTIAITANATDNAGVTGVQFQLNGAAFGPKLSAAPYSVQWDTRSVGNGNYQWTAVAQDAAGNTATSSVVMAVVSNPDVTAPTVNFLTPANNSTVSGTVGVTASASDNIGVAGVQYTLNGAALSAEMTVAPYSYSWNTSALAPATYTLTATARDAAGNRSTANVSVTIKDTTAPTVRISSPTAGQTIGGTVNLTATASDNVRVVGVQFLVDGAAYGAESTSGFSVSCNTANLSNGAHVISAIARDAAGNKTTAATVSTNVYNAPPPPPPPTSTTTAVARINAGGGAYTDPQGNAWSADYGHNGGYQWDPALPVSGTTAPNLYKSQHWHDGVLVYTIPVANGSYTVNLKWAELYCTRVGERVFNININGQRVQSNFDILAAAGGFGKALDRSYPVSVTGGKIVIEFASTVENPTISAIEVLKTTTSTPTTPAPKTVIRVNAGGPTFTDAAGNTWSADTGSSGGYPFSTGAAISNTATPAIYKTVRWADGTLGYQFSVPNGTYTVNLKFAEVYWTGANQRVFNILINGQTVLPNFDVFAQAGGINRAIDKAFTVNVTNGTVSIQLKSTVDNPMISALEIFN